MFVRNFLTAGDFVTVMPIGLILTFEYDENGRISRVLHGTQEDGVDISSAVLTQVLESDFVPRTIPTKDGTSWISGVAYREEDPVLPGTLPECVGLELLSDFKTNIDAFKFYAGMVTSLAAVHKGAVACRNWLTLAKFDVLPGYVVPHNLTDDTFIHMIESSRFPFDFPKICGYIIYHNGQPDIRYLNYTQGIIKKCVKVTDGLGYVYADLTIDVGADEPKKLLTEYRNVVSYNLTSNVRVLMDGDEIFYSDSTVHIDEKLTCDDCGKLYPVNLSGRTCCSDPNCTSRLFGETNRFLKQFSLPEITEEKYKAYVKSLDSYYVPDILDENTYSDVNMEVPVADLIRAAIPFNVVPQNSDVLTRICNRCNNAVAAIEHYMKNPDRILPELEIDGTEKLEVWLGKHHNITTVMKCLHSDHLHPVAKKRKFEGAPIFRNWNISITGEFIHGTREDIVAILNSYSANVTDDVESARCLIVGGTQEGIKGRMVQTAKNFGIKIFTEQEFFDAYEIDKDLAENL